MNTQNADIIQNLPKTCIFMCAEIGVVLVHRTLLLNTSQKLRSLFRENNGILQTPFSLNTIMAIEEFLKSDRLNDQLRNNFQLLKETLAAIELYDLVYMKSAVAAMMASIDAANCLFYLVLSFEYQLLVVRDICIKHLFSIDPPGTKINLHYLFTNQQHNWALTLFTADIIMYLVDYATSYFVGNATETEKTMSQLATVLLMQIQHKRIPLAIIRQAHKLTEYFKLYFKQFTDFMNFIQSNGIPFTFLDYLFIYRFYNLHFLHQLYCSQQS